ncbi:glycoside hydrolase family 2 TIM barrel-domain containing protein [Isoptericola sp. NPDC056618]|uniref:glycoside hydrolase family 2 protein n=1 Tax=Isoptericola sp. NPDC056618 TaxID=3345878 RepID=UPI0036C52190
MPTIDLGGSAWQVKEYLPGDWSRADLVQKARGDAHGWIDAHVPGSVQADLWAAGDIEDPYHGRNSRAVEWVADRTWVYVRTFETDPAWRGRRVRLRFEGVDYEARFVLNGVVLGTHVGMSTPVTFEVGDLLRDDGPNELGVVLAPAPPEQDQMGRTSLVRTRKSRMGYWWDFCPRMVNLGLWDTVALDVTGRVRVVDLHPRPLVDVERRVAEVSVATTVDVTAPVDAQFDLEITRPDGGVLRMRRNVALEPGEGRVELSATIDDAELWWPNGAGEQPLYSAAVTVLVAGEASDSAVAGFGLRTLEVVRNATDDPTAPPYTFVVNGRPIYLNGWNWVPLDVLYGRVQDDKLRHVLDLAARAHVNLLRVNGVGVVERSRFYEECDRLGIMVWQEFLVTSSEQDRKPSEDRAYLDEVVDEARRIVPRRRSHPSLVAWCAGNELESLDKLPLDDREPLIAALKEVVAELDPDRHWLPTSPVGRKPFNGLSSIRRDPDGLQDVHGPWLYEGLTEQYELYDAGTSLLHSEFGVEGLTNLETLRDVLPAEELDVTRLQSPVWRHLSAWWVRPELWQEWLGPLDDLETAVDGTQLLQAEGVRYAIESNRRRSPRNSGSLPWQFNEPYPMAACTSAIDYHARPKALYYAVARAYAPLALSARYDTVAWAGRAEFRADLWAVNAGRAAVLGAEVVARVVGTDGTIYHEVAVGCDLPDALPSRLGAVTCPLDLIETEGFFLDIRMSAPDGGQLAAWRTPFSRTRNLMPLLHVAPTSLFAELVDGGSRARIVNTGPHAAMQVAVREERAVRDEGAALIGDSHFDLLPGEVRDVAIEWCGAQGGARRITVRAMNAPAATALRTVPGLEGDGAAAPVAPPGVSSIRSPGVEDEPVAHVVRAL